MYNIKEILYYLLDRIEKIEQTVKNGLVISGGSEGGTSVLSDWSLSNSLAPDFIKNKPTNVSAFNNDAGYLNQHLDLSNYILKNSTTGLLKNDGTIDTNTYLTSHQSLLGYILTSLTTGLIKNDGTIDTNTYALIWRGTQALYDALSPNYDNNTIYIITT